MEAALSSEMSFCFYQITWCQIQKEAIFIVTASEHLESPLTNVIAVIQGTYEVRQFNFHNGPVKAKFAYCCEAVHFVRRWCHCQKQSWKSFSRIPRSNVFTLRWMSERSKNLCPFVPFFNFGKSQKLQGAKSGEYGGWSIFVMEFLARNLRTLNESCAGALSCWRIHLLGQSLGLLLRTDSCILVTLPNNTVDLPFVRVQWIHSQLSPCDWRSTQAWCWPVTKTCVFFSAEVCFPLHALWFCVRVVWKRHISSPVMTPWNISALCKRSDEM